MLQLRALAATREPSERKLESLEHELLKLQRDKSDLATDLAKAKAEVSSCELQVGSAACHSTEHGAWLQRAHALL